MQLGLDFALVEQLVAGVDEVGRGPLCGPVVTAAVILDPLRPIHGLNDSKKLSEARREALYEEICAKALAWCIARAEVATRAAQAIPHPVFRLNIEPSIRSTGGTHTAVILFMQCSSLTPRHSTGGGRIARSAA